MKLIVDKATNGLTTKEFVEYLKTPIPKTTFTKEEASLFALFFSFEYSSSMFT